MLSNIYQRRVWMGLSLMLGFILLYGIYLGVGGHNTQHYKINLQGIFVLLDEQIVLTAIEQVVSDRQSDMDSDIKAIERVLAKQPLIDSSTIRYAWPNQLFIDIEEIAPIAFVKGYGYLLADCQMIEHQAVRFPIPTFELQQTNLDELSCHHIQQILPYLEPTIAHVIVMSNHDIRIPIDRVEYVLGKELDRGFGKLKLLQNKLQSHNKPLLVDLRYTTGMALREIEKL